MHTLLNSAIKATAKNISFKNEMLCVELLDGREVNVPIIWFPKLSHATKEQLNNWRFIGNGVGVHWEELDEDISVEGLLK
jgi:hypothetical protein